MRMLSSVDVGDNEDKNIEAYNGTLDVGKSGASRLTHNLDIVWRLQSLSLRMS